MFLGQPCLLCCDGHVTQDCLPVHSLGLFWTSREKAHRDCALEHYRESPGHPLCALIYQTHAQGQACAGNITFFMALVRTRSEFFHYVH